ncbi:MAG: (Fe-S)-binding protein [Promethearchaeota archaeon]|jgi:Fe-S oxidoreductase
MQIIRSLWQGKLDLSRDMAEVIYQCPTCNACAEACAYEMDNALMYEALRAELVKTGFGLEAHIPMNKAIIEFLNPYERDNKQKSEWLSKSDFKIKDAYSEKADVLYFVGCTAALTPEIQTVAINTTKILKKFNVDFAVYGEQEVCCGSIALRTGNREAFNSVAKKNYELFQKTEIKTIITSCAGCFRTLKVDYADFFEDFNVEVLHTVEFIKDFIEQNDIEMRNLGINVTYHDPCHTGRNTGDIPLYEEPRELIREIANLIEMKTIKENTKCCGAGGGVKKGFPDLALEIAKSRVEEAEETGADYLVSICPFCYRNLFDAIKALNSNIKMIDLTELINKALG